MATSKTLQPTNVTIQIPAFTDKPDQRVNSNCIDKEADAINALSEQIATLFKWVPAVGKIIESGSLSAGDYGVTTSNVVIPSGYKATGICNLGWNHPGSGGAAGMVGSVGIASGVTGTQTLYLSYYTPRTIAYGNTDFTIYVECIKSDYSLS